MTSWAENKINEMIEERLFLVKICIGVGIVFALLGWFTGVKSDSGQVALMGAVVFLGFALAYGLQARKWRRDLDKALNR